MSAVNGTQVDVWDGVSLFNDVAVAALAENAGVPKSYICRVCGELPGAMCFRGSSACCGAHEQLVRRAGLGRPWHKNLERPEV